MTPAPSPISPKLQEIEDRHSELAALAKVYLGNHTITISIVSVNDSRPGQLILSHPDYLKSDVIQRLRLCANILEQSL